MSNDGINERRTLSRYPGSSQHEPSDEISLLDVWEILSRRRRQIALISLLILGLAVAYVLLRHRHYSYTTALNIGTYVNKGANGENNTVFVEPLSAVEQKLKQAFIPVARQKLGTTKKAAPKVDVDTQKNGSLILLKTKGTKTDAERVTKLQQSIVSQLVASERSILKPIQENDKLRLEKARNELSYVQSDAVKLSRLQPFQQKTQTLKRHLAAMADAYKSQHLDLENKIASIQRDFDALNDARRLMEGEKKRIGQKEALISSQLEEQQSLVNQLQKTRLQATDKVKNSADAMTLLMVGTQVDSAQQRIDGLVEKLKVGLPQKKDDIIKSLADNARSQQDARAKIVSLKTQLNKLESDYKRKRGNEQAKIVAATTAYKKAEEDYQQDIDAKKRNVQAMQAMSDQVIPTQALFTSIRSTKPSGVGAFLIIIMGIVVGLILAIFSALLSEFIGQANRYVASKRASSQNLVLDVKDFIESDEDKTPKAC